jgi:cytosine/adenosine deaminase-related metal-dependent hydrolase
MEDEDVVDACIEHKAKSGCKMLISVCTDLKSAGLIESRYKLSPIMLLHKLGLLTSSVIVGGNYLDRDDLELMAQEGASLVLLPSFSMGYGLGAPQATFCRKYVKCALGTADCKYNPSADLISESYLLRLISALNSHDEAAFSVSDAYDMCVKNGDMSEWERAFVKYARIT